jgi:hypothetical protein
MKTTMIIARAFLGAALVLGLFLGGCEGNVNDDTVPVLSIDLVSRSADGDPAKGTCYSPSLSSDGNLVVFDTYSTGMHPLDTNGRNDVFVRDAMLGTTEIVSMNAAGTGSANNDSQSGMISADGQFVAFVSYATDLTPLPAFNLTNYNNHVFVRDLYSGITVPVTVNSAETGLIAYGAYFDFFPAVVSDATNVYVVFACSGTDVVSTPDMSAAYPSSQIYLRRIPRASFTAPLTPANIQAGETILVTYEATAADTDNWGEGESRYPAIAQGTSHVYVTWSSSASDLIAADGNSQTDVFWRSVSKGSWASVPAALGATTLVSVRDDSTQGDGSSEHPAISADGEYVAFDSYAKNLFPDVGGLPEDVNGKRDVYRRGPLVTGGSTLVRVSEGGLGQATGDSTVAALSGDGSIVVFTSAATNLVADDTNEVYDVFMNDLGAGGVVTRVSMTVFSAEPTSQSGYNSSYERGADISGDGTIIVFPSRAQILPGISLFEGQQIYRRKY